MPNTSQNRIHRRAVLKGVAGATLVLPVLEAMGEQANANPAARFCALYTANGMSLPKKQNNIEEWNWFPKSDKDGKLVFGMSTRPLEKHRSKLSFLGGLQHDHGIKSDPHVCSDMWLTGAPLHRTIPGKYNTVSLDQVVAQHTKQYCRQPSLVLSIDAGTGFQSRTGTISFTLDGKPIPAENSPRRIFDRLFTENRASLLKQRKQLKRKMKLVDAVLENARQFNRRLGNSDRQKIDQYLTSLNEIESRLLNSEKWLDVPVKKQDRSHLDLSVTNESKPSDYYQIMFDLIALAFDADITRSVTFMLNREDGMGISDAFPLKLGLSRTHHQLSHAGDKEGQLMFAKYDLFLSEQVAYFLDKLESYNGKNGTVLDNSLILFGSGASTTHNPRNLPTLIAGGGNLGLKQGQYWRKDKEKLSNVYLSILRSLGIESHSFADSNGTTANSIFSRI